MRLELIRKRNLARLKKAKLTVSPSLPLRRGAPVLRPPRAIAARLMALDAVSCWVVDDDVETKSALLRSYVKGGGLAKWMTRSERAIFATSRAAAHKKFVELIGWRFENMWPLAWALGFGEEPAPDGKEIENSTVRAMVLEFLPGLHKGPDALVAKAAPRSLDEVAALEDLFYCAHNAARSAQLGGKTVPKGFDPVSGGGVIHERRHALSWCLSDEDWDDVDLST